MISVNISYKRLILPKLFFFAALLVMSGCGNKTNPLPPIVPAMKQPEKPILIQKGDSIIVKIANPFAGRTDGWDIELLRLNKMVMPMRVGTSKEKPEDIKQQEKPGQKAAATETQPELIVISTDSAAFKKTYSEIPKIDAKQFTGEARKILELSGKDKGREYKASEIIYIDPKKYEPKRIHPEVFYYAVNMDDPNNEVGSLSAVSSIVTLPIAPAPVITDWAVDKKTLNIKLSAPEDRYESAADASYFTGFNLYKGNCDTPQKTPVLAKPFDYCPEAWKYESILRFIPLYENDDKNKGAGIGIIFGGKKKQEIRQTVADEKNITALQNSLLHLKAEIRYPGGESFKARIQFDDGREGKLIETKIDAGSEWKTFESDFNVYHYARKLDIVLSPENETLVEYLEIKNISLKIVKMQSSGENKDVGSAKPEKNKSKAASAEQQRTLKTGDELIRNGNFSEFPPIIIVDEKYSLEKDVCYSAVSTLQIYDDYYESENGESKKIYVKDTFLPETVKGIYSLAKLDSITIFWNANSEKDLAGYNIYRKGENEEKFVKINPEIIKRTEYTDIPPMINIKYIYYIVAVDNSLSSNESKPGEKVEFIARIRPEN